MPVRVTQQGATLKMAIAAINGTYEGKMSSDGNSISGKLESGRTATTAPESCSSHSRYRLGDSRPSGPAKEDGR